MHMWFDAHVVQKVLNGIYYLSKVRYMLERFFNFGVEVSVQIISLSKYSFLIYDTDIWHRAVKI